MFVFIGLTLVSAPCARAEEEFVPLVVKGLYEFSYSGVVIGKMGIEVDQTPEHYAITSDVISTGLLKLFVNHTSHTTVSASGKNFSYPTLVYETNYQTKKKKKYVTFRYKDGELVDEKLVPPDNRATRPAVPDELKKKASDPLSFILKMRQGLYETLHGSIHLNSLESDSGKEIPQEYIEETPLKKGTTFSVDLFDGRRLTRVDFTIEGKKTIAYQGTKAPTIDVIAKRTLVSGYTESELSDQDKHEPPLHIYFKDDATLLPIRFEVKLFLGTLTARLARECLAGESCLLGISE